MVDETANVQKVTYTRRFFGSYLLEALLIGVTLIIGWLIWLTFTANTSQSPAKRLLNIHLLDINTGQPISAGRVWARELLVKVLLVGLLNFVIVVAWLVDCLWVFFDRNRQALHDKVVGTIVVYAPYGLPASLKAPSEALPASSPSATGGTFISPSQAYVKDAAERVPAHHPNVVLWDVYAALAKRLSSKYDVHMRMRTKQYGGDSVIVRKAPWMAIAVRMAHDQNQTTLRFAYDVGSTWLTFLLVLLVIPLLALIPLARSRSRKELEEDVKSAIRSYWSELAG